MVIIFEQPEPYEPLPPRKRQGFASLTPERRREVASKAGKAAHALGTAHKWNREEAQAAGRKGGAISRRGPKKLT